MKIYSCGQCGGPLQVSGDESVVVCSYCGFSNNVVSLEADFESFKKEVKSWLSNLGVVGQSGIDAGMRLLYFKDEIYPDLATEFTNIVGDVDVILDYPLVYLPIYSQLPDLAVRTQWDMSNGKPMKKYARKLESPELMSFAVDAKTKKLLLELRLDATLIPMLMDVVNLTIKPTPEHLQQCANTLEYLAQEIDPLITSLAGDDDLKDYVIYYEILKERIALAAESYKLLAETIANRSPVEKAWLNNTVRRLVEMRAQTKALGGVSVIDRVPMEAGLANDAEALLTWRDVVSSYLEITEKPFEDFITSLNAFSAKTFFYNQKPRPGVDTTWFTDNMDSKKFTWFVGALGRAINERTIVVVPPDKGPQDAPFYYPFYFIYVKTILRSGALWWKKGESEDFYALCDAAFNLFPNFYSGDYPSLLTPSGKKIIGKKVDNLLESLKELQPSGVSPESLVLPPTVSPQDAEMIFVQAHNFREEAEIAKSEGRVVEVPSSYKRKGFDPGRVKAVIPQVKALYYLPMAIVNGKPIVFGEKYGIETELAFRRKFASDFEMFLRSIK